MTEFVRHWRNQSTAASIKSAFVALTLALGEAFQFDWSEAWLVVGAHLRLSHFGRLIHSAVVIYTHKRLVKIQRAQVVNYKSASTHKKEK